MGSLNVTIYKFIPISNIGLTDMTNSCQASDEAHLFFLYKHNFNMLIFLAYRNQS